MPSDTVIGRHFDETWIDGVQNGQPKGYQYNDGSDVVIPQDGSGWSEEVVFDGGADGSLVKRSPFLDGSGNSGFMDGQEPYTTIYFGFDQFGIDISERSKLLDAYNFMSANPGIKLVLEGHTDWRGTNEYNMALGERRANSAMIYLLDLGAFPNAISVRSRGELEATEGVEKNDPIAKRDRRVDLLFLNN